LRWGDNPKSYFNSDLPKYQFSWINVGTRRGSWAQVRHTSATCLVQHMTLQGPRIGSGLARSSLVVGSGVAESAGQTGRRPGQERHALGQPQSHVAAVLNTGSFLRWCAPDRQARLIKLRNAGDIDHRFRKWMSIQLCITLTPLSPGEATEDGSSGTGFPNCCHWVRAQEFSLSSEHVRPISTRTCSSCRWQSRCALEGVRLIPQGSQRFLQARAGQETGSLEDFSV